MMTQAHNHNPMQNCLVIGLGQTGLSCARFLREQGMNVAVMDSRETPPALEALQQCYPDVVVRTGGFDSSWLTSADLVVLSPGVDPRTECIATAREQGVEIIGDIELFARFAKAPIVAITGSNGKSTVTTLVSQMAETAGKQVKTGGNIGTPALDLLDGAIPDFYVLELSSFQLETVRSLNALAATVLNVSPDHLDRYDSLTAYREAKQRIFNGDGVRIINLDDAQVAAMRNDASQQLTFSLTDTQADFHLIQEDGKQWIAQHQEKLLQTDQLAITGQHNYANALAALALASVMALPMPAMLTALSQFKGLPHRCRLVRLHQGVRWLNDSKATNVGATIAAIQGLAPRGPIILIAGGQAKDQDFTPLTAVLGESVKAVVLIGEDASAIAACVPATVRCQHADSLQHAVAIAAGEAEAGDAVLMSPACASFDMFKGFADRGEQFEQLVRGLA